MEAWQHQGICKVCGEDRVLDCTNYCTTCYPYGGACEAYKAGGSTVGKAGHVDCGFSNDRGAYVRPLNSIGGK